MEPTDNGQARGPGQWRSSAAAANLSFSLMKLLSGGNDANAPALSRYDSLERDLSYNLNLWEDLRRNLPLRWR